MTTAQKTDKAYRKWKFTQSHRDWIAYKKIRAKFEKELNSNLSCDVELGGIGTNLKSISTIMMIGGIGYLVYRFKLFKGLKWLTDAFKDIVAAPATIAKWEDGEVGTRVDQIDKMFNILKTKGDNFAVDYGNLNSEWQTLKSKAVSSFGKESYKKTFYQSAKMSYFGSKSSKEKLMGELDRFRTKVLQALRALQVKKGFKISGNWQIIGNLSCFPFC